MKFELPHFPHRFEDFEPIISRKAMVLHYQQHLGGYINKLNELLEDMPEFHDKSLEYICRYSAVNTPIYNNANQAWNHIFLFEALKKHDIGSVSRLPEWLQREFDCNATTIEKINKASTRFFGSGWTWICWNKPSKAIDVWCMRDAENPLKNTHYVPLFCIDLWEHQYYLDFYNQRNNFLDAFWSIIDWDVVKKRYDNAVL